MNSALNGEWLAGVTIVAGYVADGEPGTSTGIGGVVRNERALGNLDRQVPVMAA